MNINMADSKVISHSDEMDTIRIKPVNHILKCHEIVKTDFVRGQGVYLYDSSDKKYVDFEAGIWCTALGYNHHKINQVIQRQLQKVIHLGTRYPNFLAEEASVAVLDAMSLPDGKCIFLSSGSEAVEFGVQSVKLITEKPLLLTFSGSYLSAYGSAGKKNSEEWFCFDWKNCNSCSFPDECSERCCHLNRIPFELIGGLVLEGNTGGLAKFPPKHLVQTLVSIIRQKGGFIIANEITTGMGRTGLWFNYQHYGIQPDIIALGKGLGNGYPVSAVAMTRDIAGRLEKMEFRYAQSHQNDPLGCAIAKEVITIFHEDGIVETGSKTGIYFMDKLKQLKERSKLIKEVRGRGLMIAVELETMYKNVSATLVYQQLLERCFIVGYNPVANILRFYPALIIGEEDIVSLLENLEQILNNGQ